MTFDPLTVVNGNSHDLYRFLIYWLRSFNLGKVGIDQNAFVYVGSGTSNSRSARFVWR